MHLETFRQLPCSFCAAEDLQSTSVKFCQFSVRPENLPSTSVNFHVDSRPFANSLCCRGNFRHLPSNFLAAGRASVNFRQVFVLPGDLKSTSDKSPCIWEAFYKLPSTYHAARRSSVNIPCGRETFREIPSTFRAARRLSVNFRHLSLRPEDLPSTLPAAGRPSVTFCQQSVRPGTCRQLYFRSAVLLSTSVHFLCRQDTFRQLPSSVFPGYLPSISV